MPDRVKIEDIIDLYYSSPPLKIKAFHVEREACIDLFYQEHNQGHNLTKWYIPGWPISREEVKIMLERGEGRIMGIPVVLSDDKPGVWMELEP